MSSPSRHGAVKSSDSNTSANPPGSTPSAQSFISDLIASSLPTTTVNGAKQALSLRTTTSHFTRFVQKAGPVFAAQDAVEKVFRWQDPLQTIFCGAVWALLCLFPHLFLLLPGICLTTILLVNHSRRFPVLPTKGLSSGQPTTSYSYSKPQPPPSGQPPTEGSVDYLQNLQNIQELMGRVADMTDAGRRLVPFVNWSNSRVSSVLLQISAASTLLIGILVYFALPYLDMRYVFMLLGEAALVATHPFSQSLTQGIAKSPAYQLRLLRVKQVITQILADDALPDEIVLPDSKGNQRTIKEIVVIESERRGLDGSWSTDALRLGKDPLAWQILLDGKEHKNRKSSSSIESGQAGSTSEKQTISSPTSPISRHSTDGIVKFETISPPYGFVWIPNEAWYIDRLGQWNGPPGVDADGWAFEDADGHAITVTVSNSASFSNSDKTASSTSESDASRKESPLTIVPASAAVRRRRWCRRIVSVPTYS